MVGSGGLHTHQLALLKVPGTLKYVWTFQELMAKSRSHLSLARALPPSFSVQGGLGCDGWSTARQLQLRIG